MLSFSSMESNLADTLLEIDSEDIADIYHMVSEWEFNFGSLEVNNHLPVCTSDSHR